MPTVIQPVPLSVLQEVIDRFVDEARRRSEEQPAARRRAERRYHRSWPLSVLLERGGCERDIGVALHNASAQGIAFLAPFGIESGTVLQIRLFWHDEDCPRVPAVVRHCTFAGNGYLVGCEFVLWDNEPPEGEPFL
jgi:hypothetical protein